MTAPLHERLEAWANGQGDLSNTDLHDEWERESQAILREAAAALRPPEGGLPQATLRPMFRSTNPPQLIGYDVVVDGRTVAVLPVAALRPPGGELGALCERIEDHAGWLKRKSPCNHRIAADLRSALAHLQRLASVEAERDRLRQDVMRADRLIYDGENGGAHG